MRAENAQNASLMSRQRVFGAGRQIAKHKPFRTYDDSTQKVENKTSRILERQWVLSRMVEPDNDKTARSVCRGRSAELLPQ
jgi:hypothetical protein